MRTFIDYTSFLSERLESNGEFERAACVCVFNNGIDRAIQILKNASKTSKFPQIYLYINSSTNFSCIFWSYKGHLNEYLALSIALSCMHRSSSADGVKESNKILTKLTNPYLKALFSYLIDSENFDYQIVSQRFLLSFFLSRFQ